MTARDWREVTKAAPCPACGKADWCARTREGWLKCERGTDAPPGMLRVSVKDGGALFKPADDPRRASPKPAGRRGGSGRVFATARDAVAELERQHGRRSAWWTYTDADGKRVGAIVRWDTATGKEIRPVSRNGAGWIIGGMPTPRPLYGLPELVPSGSRVYVTEGEKAADAARAVGLTATTSPHGCKAASKADWSPLAGRDVVILPDHDDAGERYAVDVARLVTRAGAESVRVVRLVEVWADMPEGGDMADLVEHRGGDLGALRTEVEALADKAELETVTPEAPAVPAFTPFPVDVLPEPIRGFVAKAAKAIGCDSSYVALPVLSGLASAIGNTHRIELKRGWPEPAILWTAIVGESGTAKSPALELALRPIRKRQHDAMKRHAAAMQQYAADLALYERDLSQWKRSKSNDPPPTKPDAPIADRCWTDDTTTEALAVLLQQNSRGLLLARDELAGWIGGFDRYAGGRGGTDAAKWLEMYGGRPMVVDRKTGGTLYVPRAAVSLAGGIQPETLRRALGQEHRDNGLAARLMLSCPPRKAKRWTEADVDANTEAAVSAVFDRLYGLTPETDTDGDDQPRRVALTPDAKAAWVRYYNEHAREQVELSGDEAAAWSKLEGGAARLALVVHLSRWAAGGVQGDPGPVDEVSIAAGVTLARWFGNEARRAYAILGESDDDRETRRLVEWIERKGGTVTARELTRGPREFRGDPDAAEGALAALVQAGIGRWEHDTHGPKGGRPARRFRLVAAVGDTGDGDETPAKAGKDAGSVTVATVAKSADGDGEWGEL